MLCLLWNLVGCLLVGIGIVGYIVPGLPGTVFLVCALFCFERGANDRARNWLFKNRLFGKTLQDWEQTKAIPARIKVIAIACIILFSGSSVFRAPELWMKLLIGGLGIAGIIYVATRKTRESLMDVAKVAEVASEIKEPKPLAVEREELPTAERVMAGVGTTRA